MALMAVKGERKETVRGGFTASQASQRPEGDEQSRTIIVLSEMILEDLHQTSVQ